MDAIVLAGGKIPGGFAGQENVTVKALLSFGGRSLLERTTAAVHAARAVERVCIVGPPELAEPARRAGADLFVEGRATGIDNLLAGIDALGAQGRVLCSASDLCALRTEDVEDLIERTPEEAALSYPVVTRREWEAVFPGARATFYRLADGEFGGGGVFVLDSGALRRIEPMLQRAFAGRKSLLGMAAVLGAPLTVRCVLGHIIHSRLGPSTDQIRGRVEMLSGCRCAVVRGCSPRVKADVDDQEDWLYTLQAMAFEPAGAC